MHKFEYKSCIRSYHIRIWRHMGLHCWWICLLWKGDTEFNWQICHSSFERWRHSHHQSSSKDVIRRLCSLFIARSGAITCVNEAQRYLVDLPQGGLKVPCKLQFFSSHKIATCSYNSNKSVLYEKFCNGIMFVCLNFKTSEPYEIF